MLGLESNAVHRPVKVHVSSVSAYDFLKFALGYRMSLAVRLSHVTRGEAPKL